MRRFDPRSRHDASSGQLEMKVPDARVWWRDINIIVLSYTNAIVTMLFRLVVCRRCSHVRRERAAGDCASNRATVCSPSSPYWRAIIDAQINEIKKKKKWKPIARADLRRLSVGVRPSSSSSRHRKCRAYAHIPSCTWRAHKCTRIAHYSRYAYIYTPTRVCARTLYGDPLRFSFLFITSLHVLHKRRPYDVDGDIDDDYYAVVGIQLTAITWRKGRSTRLRPHARKRNSAGGKRELSSALQNWIKSNITVPLLNIMTSDVNRARKKILIKNERTAKDSETLILVSYCPGQTYGEYSHWRFQLILLLWHLLAFTYWDVLCAITRWLGFK